MLVTHDPEVGDACDRIVRMRDGKIREAPASSGSVSLPETTEPALVGAGAASNGP